MAGRTILNIVCVRDTRVNQAVQRDRALCVGSGRRESRAAGDSNGNFSHQITPDFWNERKTARIKGAASSEPAISAWSMFLAFSRK
jgi:hypothetical protein